MHNPKVSVHTDGNAKPPWEIIRPPDVYSMDDRALLIEAVVNTRQIMAFAAEVANGVEEFHEKFKNNPIMRFFGG